MQVFLFKLVFEMLFVIGSIVFLFFILLVAKEFLPEKLKTNFCALCGAVSLTWFTFLILYFVGLFSDKIILALLMGGSVVGFLYFVGKKVIDSWKLFRLPFFLTLLITTYSVIELSFDIRTFIVIILLWLVFSVFFLYRNTGIMQKIIACCRDL